MPSPLRAKLRFLSIKEQDSPSLCLELFFKEEHKMIQNMVCDFAKDKMA